jgi:hypothetical protein
VRKIGADRVVSVDLHVMLAERFPLVARTRPVCRALGARVAQVRALADLAARDTDESLVRAAEAHNLAALIASDCGLPDLARTFCQRQAQVFLAARSFTTETAKPALQPLINLARLLIRDGDGDGAYHLLVDLFTAIKSRSEIGVAGQPIALGALISDDDDHCQIVQWLWAVLLADGTRALTRAGRWAEALQHVEQHKGVGQRMFDGRQVAVIAAATTGDAAGALALLEDTAPGDPWETAVTACLAVFCRQAACQPIALDVAAMLDSYQQLVPAPGLAVFQTRLGLSVIDLAGGVDHSGARDVAAGLARRAVEFRDGYAAREVLRHGGCLGMLPDDQARVLAELVEACALDRRELPEEAEAELLDALDISESAIRRQLRHSSQR